MHNATSRGFSIRGPGDGLITTQNFTPGNKLQTADVSNAKDAVLHKGAERILVRQIVKSFAKVVIGPHPIPKDEGDYFQ